jgi:hypothetical protein
MACMIGGRRCPALRQGGLPPDWAKRASGAHEIEINEEYRSDIWWHGA